MRWRKKFGEPWFWRGFEGEEFAVERELKALGVEGVVGEDELGALRVGEAIGDEIDVEVFVGAVNLVADDGVADVG